MFAYAIVLCGVLCQPFCDYRTQEAKGTTEHNRGIRHPTHLEVSGMLKIFSWTRNKAQAAIFAGMAFHFNKHTTGSDPNFMLILLHSQTLIRIHHSGKQVVLHARYVQWCVKQ